MKKFITISFCLSLIILADNIYYKSRFIELQKKIPETKLSIQKLKKQLVSLKKAKLSIQKELENKVELDSDLRNKLIQNIFNQEEIIDKKNLLEKQLIAIEKEAELLKKILNTTISLSPEKIPTSSKLQDNDYLTFDFNKISINRNFQRQIEKKIFIPSLQKKATQIKQFLWTFKLKEITVNKVKIQFVPFITVK